MGYLRLDEHANGLDTEMLRHVGKLVHDYDENLIFRRIPSSDPRAAWAAQQRPPHEFGVWESNVGSLSLPNWVFTIPSSQADARVLARIIEADYRRQGANERVAKAEALRAAGMLYEAKARAEQEEAQREEMLSIADLARRKSEFRHKINGETYIVGSTLRKAKPNIL